MPADEILAGLLQGLFRVLMQFFVEVILEGFCCFIGFWTLRLLSVGRYPPPTPTERQLHLCSIVGLVETVAAIVAIVWFV